MANKSTFINDLTEGSVMKRLIRFTLPLMLANLLQVCYNLVDMFFVGQYAGTDALSAVSISSNVTMLMFFCFMGIATGGQIYVAQTVGAGRRDKLDRIVGNSLTLCVLVSLILMLTIPLATPILRLINTPEEILGVTRTYLIICTAGNVTVALYNALCGILRGMGDSRHPTMFVAISTAVNIVLDYLFVAVLHWGVAGAAWATVIGQTTACVFALVYLFRKREMLGFDFKLASFGLKSGHVRVILRIGAPIIIKNLFISISVIFVNAMIYRFGVTAAAVIGVCGKLQSLMQVISQAMMDGSASMVGQSVGAGKPGARQAGGVGCHAAGRGLCRGLDSAVPAVPPPDLQHLLQRPGGHRDGPALYDGVQHQYAGRRPDEPHHGPYQRRGRHTLQYDRGHCGRRGRPAGAVPPAGLHRRNGGAGLLSGQLPGGLCLRARRRDLFPRRMVEEKRLAGAA